MSLSTTGPRVRRWGRWRRQEHAVVIERANGACEGCGAHTDVLEVAHLAGRQHIISEPWASSAALTTALCCARTWGFSIGCHGAIDQGKDDALRDLLRQRSITRMAKCLDVEPGAYMFPNPLDGIRTLVRLADERGVTPPGYVRLDNNDYREQP